REVFLARLALDQVIAVADHRLAVVRPESTPARPEHDREDGADDPHDHQDHADRLEVDAGDVRANRPGEDRAGGDEKQTESDAHESPPLRENAVPPFGLDTWPEADDEGRTRFSPVVTPGALSGATFVPPAP